jgi:hypothetical protein
MKLEKKSFKQLVRQLDAVFSEFVKWRDGWQCITCTCKVDPYASNTEQMHAGHCVGRNNFAVRWDEINVNAQCKSCNYGQKLNDDNSKYLIMIDVKYGDGAANELVVRAQGKSKFSSVELIEKIQYYQKRVLELKENDRLMSV